MNSIPASRKEALELGAKKFLGTCSLHGNVDFYTLKNCRSGQCVTCAKGRSTKSRHEKPERKKAWSIAHYEANKDSYKARAKNWNSNNKPRRAEITKKSREKSPRAQEQQNSYKKQRYSEDVNYAIECRLRARVYCALKAQKAYKSGRTVGLIGCSYEEFRHHIESQFLPGMSWDNRKLWHIDHIKPCASFDLTDEAQQQECFHYSNQRPLWASENYSKGAKLEYVFEIAA